MGLSVRYFVAEDDRTVTRVPRARYQRWFLEDEALPAKRAARAQTVIEQLEADADYFWVPTDRELEALGTALLKRRPGPAERAELRAAVFRPGSVPKRRVT